jgi:hypothetical protein
MAAVLTRSNDSLTKTQNLKLGGRPSRARVKEIGRRRDDVNHLGGAGSQRPVWRRAS